MSKRPLEGIVVVAAEVAEAGPCATQILSMLGAEVTRVDRCLAVYPPIFKDGVGDAMMLRNTNKYLVGIDSKREEGKELIWKMIERADVFLENYAPGAQDRLGFSYEAVKKRNPEIVYISLKGFSKNSRWANSLAVDPVGATSGGSAYLNGYEDYLPMMSGLNIGDSGTSTHTAVSMLLAILQKKLTGKGQYIETPMQNAVTVNCRAGFGEYYANGGKVRRAGNSYKGLKPSAPWNLYPTLGDDIQGNHVCISCRPEEEFKDFEHLCKAIGREDLLNDPKYATAELRYINRLALDAEISKWTLCRNRAEVMQKLGIEAGVPVGKVMSIDDIINDPFLNDGHHIIETLVDETLINRPLPMPTIPIVIDRLPKITPKSCGEVGSGNHEMFVDILGLDQATYDKYVDEKIIDK